MVDRYSVNRRWPEAVSAEAIDRILIGVCAAIWLALIGVSVAATIAVVNLGRGFRKMTSSPHTTWVLYAVIIVSALVIAGAIPALLRARRMAATEPAAWSVGTSASGRQSSRLRSTVGPVGSKSTTMLGRAGGWSEVDRIWLRGTVALTAAMGMAFTAVATATYLMAVSRDSASWVCYGVAGAVTLTMPAIDWLHARQLRCLDTTQ